MPAYTLEPIAHNARGRWLRCLSSMSCRSCGMCCAGDELVVSSVVPELRLSSIGPMRLTKVRLPDGPATVKYCGRRRCWHWFLRLFAIQEGVTR